MEASNAPPPRLSAASSKERIMAAGTVWNKVLDVPIAASAEQVKRAYRLLALLHHPDKADGDADTFKRVKEAYEVGLKKAERRLAMVMKSESKSKGRADVKMPAKGEARTKAKAKAKSKAKAKADEEADTQSKPAESKIDHARAAFSRACEKEEAKAARTKASKPQPWRLPEDASKAKVRKAVAAWQSSERWQEKAKPEDVQTLIASDLAAHLQAGSCIAIDVLDAASISLEIAGAAQLSFSVLISTPEELAAEINRLRVSGKLLVLISDKGEQMSACGLVGALLLDVFGFDCTLVRRLDGGYSAWREWCETHQDVAKILRPVQAASSSTSTPSDRGSRKRARPKLWEMPAGANAAKVHKGIQHWESSDRWDEKTLPDQVSEISPKQLAEWIRSSACATIDARKASDVALEGSQLGVHEAVPISFSQMVLSPGEVLQQLMQLKKEGKRLVLFSEVGSRMDVCSLLGALLVDVIGFEQQLIYRLQGGCAAWCQWLEENKDEARTLESLSVRLERVRRRRAARTCAPPPATAFVSSLGAWAAACEVVSEPADAETAQPQAPVHEIEAEKTDAEKLNTPVCPGSEDATADDEIRDKLDSETEQPSNESHLEEEDEKEGEEEKEEEEQGEEEQEQEKLADPRRSEMEHAETDVEEQEKEDDELGIGPRLDGEAELVDHEMREGVNSEQEQQSQESQVAGEEDWDEEKHMDDEGEEQMEPNEVVIEHEKEQDMVVEEDEPKDKDAAEALRSTKARCDTNVDYSIWTAASPCRVARKFAATVSAFMSPSA